MSDVMRRKTIARLLCLDEIPHREQSVPVELPGQRSDPERAVGFDELIVALRTELARVPPRYRDLLVLRDPQEVPMPLSRGAA